MVDSAAVGGELVFGEAGECVVELAQQAGTVFGQAPEQRHGVRHGVAHQGGGDGEGGDECAEFFEPLPLSGFDEPPGGDVGGQRSFGKERQRDDAYYIRMQPVEKCRRGSSPVVARSLPAGRPSGHSPIRVGSPWGKINS